MWAEGEDKQERMMNGLARGKIEMILFDRCSKKNEKVGQISKRSAPDD